MAVDASGRQPAEGRAPAPAAIAALETVLGAVPDRWLHVDVPRQLLFLVLGGAVIRRWPVSTAAAGIDAREGSGGTPPGVHRIARRIGQGRPPGAEFVSRKPTGRVWPLDALPRDAGRDLILTRVLTLDGCQDGVNRGPGVDSMGRYIYLHGTNREDLLGKPVSAGCIRLGNLDIIEVCDLVREGDPVVIT